MLQIDEKFYIDIDKFQYILKRKEVVQSGKRKGEDILYDEGYFSSLTRLLERYAHLNLNSEFPDNVEKLTDVYKKLEESIRTAGKQIERQLKLRGEDRK